MITLNNSAEGQAGASSLTFSLTVNQGANRCLVVAVAHEFTGITVSSVTFNGVGLTQIPAGTAVNNNEIRADLYYLVNPEVTTANVVVTMTNTSNIIGMAQVFDGVDQNSPVNISAVNNGASGNLSVNITPTKNNNVIVDCVATKDHTGSITANVAQTVIHDNETSPLDGGMSYKAQTTAAATSMAWTQSVSDRWAHAALSLTPALTGGFFALI